LYNILFTTLPLLLLGIWDQDVSYESALKVRRRKSGGSSSRSRIGRRRRRRRRRGKSGTNSIFRNLS